MSSYDSLLSAAPPMRLYNALSNIAPNSGFAKKTRKVKSMAAGMDNASAKKRKAIVKPKSKAIVKPKSKAIVKPRSKVSPTAARRGNRSRRRTLINIGGEGNGLGL